MQTFGINGFGRIGRTSLRVWWENHRDDSELVLINTSGSMEIEQWVHLLKYDSNYGVFGEEITVEREQSKADVSNSNPVLGNIKIGDRRICITAQRDPKLIPWGKYGVDVVIDSTGVFTSEEKASQQKCNY